jgi:hypothetical protein
MSSRLDRIREELEELLRAPQDDFQGLERLAQRVTADERRLLIVWMREFAARQKDLTESVVDDVQLLIEVEEYLEGDDTIVDAWARFPEPLKNRLRVYLVRTGVAPPD